LALGHSFTRLALPLGWQVLYLLPLRLTAMSVFLGMFGQRPAIAAPTLADIERSFHCH